MENFFYAAVSFHKAFHRKKVSDQSFFSSKQFVVLQNFSCTSLGGLPIGIYLPKNMREIYLKRAVKT